MSNSANGRTCNLVIGGTSGLGGELAARLGCKTGHSVVVTGRSVAKSQDFPFAKLLIRDDYFELRRGVEALMNELAGKEINMLVYAAGAPLYARIDLTSDSDLRTAMNLNLVAPMHLVQAILERQRVLAGLIVITSTSSFTPREREPVYAAGKAGLSMLANSLSLDPRIRKTLNVAPGGMNTNFYASMEIDRTMLLDPAWVADQIMTQYDEDYVYRHVKIPREPREVQVVETRVSR